MKKFTFYSNILLLGFFWGITIMGSGQTTIWSEDFSTYTEGTGIDGTGNIGDYPAGVTKWTLDVSACTLSNADDYIKTNSEKLKSTDLDGSAIWLSESIDLSAYSNGATFSIKFYEYSSMEPEDYIDVHYQINGGDFVLISNWNGHGSDIHTLIDDFSKDTVVQSVDICNNLVIKVTFNNDSGFEEFQMDDVFVYPNMEYASSTTTQNAHNIAAEKTNQQIIGMEIITTGTENPINITQFTINANGSSNPVSTNIENAKIYYTGTNNIFTTDTQFGSTYTSPTTSNFDITGTQQLSEGTNYFWLTFDTKTDATIGELIDAECISFVIDGSTETPTITAPNGSRTITAPLSGDYTIAPAGDYATFTAAVNDLNDLGISDNVSFSVASGTYTEQISLLAIDGTSATDTIIFQSSTNNSADVILQFTQTSTANYVVNFDGSDYVSFLDMTIQSTGSSSYGKVFVFKGTTQNITLKDNNIIGRNINSDSDDYIVIFGEVGTSNMSTNINIENDTIRYGSRGIYFYGGDASNLETGNSFENNVIENFYHCGIDIAYQDAVVVNLNRINSKGVSTIEQGIKTNYCNNDIEITQNRVMLSAADQNTGIELNSCYGTIAMPGLIANNFTSITVANFTTVGINIENSGHQNIYHNSINTYTSSKNNNIFRSGTQAGFGIIHYWTDVLFEGLKILNNIIVSGSLKGIEVSHTTADNGYMESSDNNDWFTLGDILGSWGSLDCADLAAWQAASGMDMTSVSDDPNYIYNESPAIANQNLKESVPELLSVPLDIDNMPRRNPTTPGAKKSCFVWVGTVNNDWNDPNNWSLGQVPTLDDDVCIDRMAIYQPDLLSDAEMRDLLMQYGSTLNANNYSMSVYGNADISESAITNDNQIILRGNEDTEFIPGSQRYNDLRVNKDSDDKWVAVDDPTDTIKFVKLSVLKGKLEARSVSVSKDADFSCGIVDIVEINFTDTENANFSSGSNTLQSVVVNKSGSAQLTLQDDLEATTLKVLDGNLNANNNVDISGNFTVSSTGNTANVNVGIGKNLAVSGITTINDGGELRLESDAGGGGHFIPQGNVQRNGTGKIIVEQYVTDGQWHLVSSPVTNATVNSLYFNGSPDVWMKEHNESDNTWLYITSLSTPMPSGKGFGYWAGVSKTDITALFEGDILTENLTLTNSSSFPLVFTDSDHGFNLVGNPYSCALDWDIGSWERTNLEGSLWVWQDAGAGDGSGDYLVRNLAGEGSLTDGIIPMCQGFFVRTLASAPLLTIPTDARVYSSQPYYKNSERELAPHIILNVSNNKNKDEVWIGFDKETTSDFDNGRDVTKLFSNIGAPQLYLSEQDYKLSIDILPELINGEERTVAMCFETATSGTYSITASSLEYLTETDIILEDLKTGILHDLYNNSEYSFTAVSGDDPYRFLIHFFYLPTEIDNPLYEENNNGIVVYAYDNSVYIKCEDVTINQTENVCIYDMFGRLLISKDLNPGSLNKINVLINNNYVVVKVRKGNCLITRKVFL